MDSQQAAEPRRIADHVLWIIDAIEPGQILVPRATHIRRRPPRPIA